MTHRSSTRRPSASRAGFSLVQITVSIALITLTATLAIPAFFGRSEVSLENAAILCAEDLRSAQNRAAYLDREVTVEFEADGTGYRLVLSGGDDRMLAIPPIARDYALDAVFEGIRVESVEVETGDRLFFRPRGFAATSARITLVDGQERRIVTLEAPGGELAIEGTTSGWTDDGL